MDPQNPNDKLNEKKDDMLKVFSEVLSDYYCNDPEMIKQIDDVLNNPEYAETIKEPVNTITDIDISKKEEVNNMVDETTEKKPVNPFDREHIADTLWNAAIKHPLATIGLTSAILIFGGIKVTEHVISRGVYLGNMKTLKNAYRMMRY